MCVCVCVLSLSWQVSFCCVPIQMQTSKVVVSEDHLHYEDCPNLNAPSNVALNSVLLGFYPVV